MGLERLKKRGADSFVVLGRRLIAAMPDAEILYRFLNLRNVAEAFHNIDERTDQLFFLIGQIVGK